MKDNNKNKDLGSVLKVATLFDLDGVLIDSETEYTKIWSEINRRYSSQYSDLAFRIKGMTLNNILETYFPDKSLHEKIRQDLYELEGKMVYNWKPGAKELLEKLMDLGIPRVLVTSSDKKKMAHLESERPDLFPLLSDIITAERITRSKPDPEGYLLGAKLAGVDSPNCAVFEDSLQGVKAGKASGSYVIGVAGTLPPVTLKPYSERVIESLEEIDPQELISILQNRKS